MKAAHITKIQRRLETAVTTLLPESTVRGEVANPDTRLRRLLARLDSAEFDGSGRPGSGWRQAASDIITLLCTDVPELMDAVREAQGAQRKYCRWCGERRLGLLTECRDEPRTWECRDKDGCDFRKNLRDARSGRPEDPGVQSAGYDLWGGAPRAACGHSLATCHTDRCFRPAGIRSGRPENPGEGKDGVL